MSTLNALLSACQAEQASLLDATRERVAQWDSWLQPLPGSSFFSDDPGYDDDFQQMRGAAECQHHETPSMTSRGDVPAIGRLIPDGICQRGPIRSENSRVNSPMAGCQRTV